MAYKVQLSQQQIATIAQALCSLPQDQQIPDHIDCMTVKDLREMFEHLLSEPQDNTLHGFTL